MNIIGVCLEGSLGVVVGNILLQMTVQLCVTVVNEEVGKVFLFNGVNHRFLSGSDKVA